MSQLAQHLRTSRLPLVWMVPAIVVLVGVATAVAVGFLGLAHLRSTSDQVAASRAEVLSAALAERLRATSSEDHLQVVRRAARRSGAEVLVAGQDGSVKVDGTLGLSQDRVLALLVAEQGEEITRIGRTKFSVHSLGSPFQTLAVIVLVPAPTQPAGAHLLLRSVVGLTSLLLGVATIVAYLFGRSLHDDVDDVRQQIEAMAKPDASSIGTLVSIRAADQVGLLTNAFNVLVDRFNAAERAYQLDLHRVAMLDRDRAAFLGALSHELRTPLNAILGFADVLLSEVDGPLDPDTRENLEMVRASGSHLRGLIDDILELSALESGQLRLSPTVVDLHAVAEDVVREAAARLSAKPLTLIVNGPAPVHAYVDERRLWQILSNLVGNAIKFTAQGSVSVELQCEGGQIIIHVSDTGAGIAEAELETIFDEYKQSGSSHSRERGTGLGLFIARRLITMHGGTIHVQSTLGQGSRFTLRFPAWPKDLDQLQGPVSTRTLSSLFPESSG